MIARALETWYVRAKRPMPWRLKPGPYVCWISEIMMQQTTYKSVLPYYERFLKRFPSLEKLAAAKEPEVLKAWEGLGYYTRARNLLKAARILAQDGWPASATAWSKVPGVGPYTAAALASVLKGERVPVVDGNVARVFARHWLLADDFSKLPARARLAERLKAEIEKAKVPGDFNQAMMELGATVCTPKNPSCAACPLARTCQARKKGTQGEYPKKPKKKALPVRAVTAVILTDVKGRVLLAQNKEGGLLKGLWELPALEPSGRFTHTFSHFKLDLSTLRATRPNAVFKDPRQVPLATATRKALSQAGLL